MAEPREVCVDQNTIGKEVTPGGGYKVFTDSVPSPEHPNQNFDITFFDPNLELGGVITGQGEDKQGAAQELQRILTDLAGNSTLNSYRDLELWEELVAASSKQMASKFGQKSFASASIIKLLPVDNPYIYYFWAHAGLGGIYKADSALLYASPEKVLTQDTLHGEHNVGLKVHGEWWSSQNYRKVFFDSIKNEVWTGRAPDLNQAELEFFKNRDKNPGGFGFIDGASITTGRSSIEKGSPAGRIAVVGQGVKFNLTKQQILDCLITRSQDPAKRLTSQALEVAKDKNNIRSLPTDISALVISTGH